MKGFLELLSDAKNRWVVLALCSFVLLFAYANDIRLSSDPVLYSAIARTMADSGDFGSLRLDDEPYYRKPPLLFWLAALAIMTFGPNPFAVTLFSRIFGLATVLLTGWLGWRLFNEKVGWAAAFILTTTFIFLSPSITFRMDSALSFGILVSIAGYLNGERDWGPPLFYAGIAVGVLAKGPPGVLPLFLAPLHALMDGSSLPVRKRLRLWILWSPLLLLPLAWWGYLLLTVGSLPLTVMFNDLVRTKLAVSRVHEFWHAYVVQLAGTYWPWLPFAVAGSWSTLRVAIDPQRQRSERANAGLLLGWIGITIVSCGLKNIQYVRYLIMAIPAISIIAGLALVRFVGNRYFDWLPRAAGIAGLIGSLVLISYPIGAYEWEREQYSAIAQIFDHRYPPKAAIPLLASKTRDGNNPKRYAADKARSIFFLGRPIHLVTLEDVRRQAALERVTLLLRADDYRRVARALPFETLISAKSFVVVEIGSANQTTAKR